MVTQSNGTNGIVGTPYLILCKLSMGSPEFLRQPSRQRTTSLAAFFCQEPGGRMHLVKQRLFNSTLNPPLPPFSKGGNFFSPFHKGGLRGIWSILTTVLIFVVICAATTTARAGQAILTWDPPTTNSDGSPLTDLAGYKVYYGPTSGNYNTVLNVANVTGYTVAGLNDNT